jgi:hypothetical protein
MSTAVQTRYRLIGVAEVCALTGWSRFTLDRRVKAGDFPEPIEGAGEGHTAAGKRRGTGEKRKWTLAQYESWAKRKQDAAEGL